MTPTFQPSPPGNEKAAPLGREHGKAGELQGTLSHSITPSSSPRAIVAQHAATLQGLSLPDFVRERLLASIIKQDAVALAVEMLADEETGGMP